MARQRVPPVKAFKIARDWFRLRDERVASEGQPPSRLSLASGTGGLFGPAIRVAVLGSVWSIRGVPVEAVEQYEFLNPPKKKLPGSN